MNNIHLFAVTLHLDDGRALSLGLNKGEEMDGMFPGEAFDDMERAEPVAPIGREREPGGEIKYFHPFSPEASF